MLEEVNINFYDISSYNLCDIVNSSSYGYTQKNIFTTTPYKKERISINLSYHIKRYRDELNEGNLDNFIKELNDTIIHELIHYVGEIRFEHITDSIAHVLSGKTTFLFNGEIKKMIIEV